MSKSQPIARLLALGVLVVLVGCKATERAPPATEAAEFTRIAQVLKSPRCINCHPAGNSPHQGDEARVHDFRVKRGADNKGAPGLNCTTCHQESNQESSGVPGAPHWQLAPLSMAWEELSDAELCRVLLDRSRNGGRSVDDLVHHMVDDALVRWAWDAGAQRAAPPIAREEFLDLVRAWAAKGGACPQAPG
jgi:hypothetical protein